MHCDRCQGPMPFYRVSFFNTARICLDCQTEEEAHPDFAYARAVEHAAFVAGNMNFPGVGWPGRDDRVTRLGGAV